MSKPLLLLDFDDTLHNRSQSDEYDPLGLGEPLENARHACCILERHFRLVCFTTRPSAQVEPWLRRWGFPKMMVTNVKTTGTIVDDRCVCFPGKWTDGFLLQLRDFKPWWAIPPEEPPSPCPKTIGT